MYSRVDSMAEIDILRNELIEELWLPMAKEAGDKFYRRRKNKQMKLFTLTDGVNFKEISRLKEEKLIRGGDAILWVSNMIKAVRAETEAMGIVFNGSICEEAILNTSCQINPLFPYDILNLDFSSQDIYVSDCRIERELEKTEHFISLQNQRHNKGFVLLQTTVIDSETINRNNVKDASNAMQLNGWGGLVLDTFPAIVLNNAQKSDLIQRVLKSLCQKYKYNIIKITIMSKDIDTQQQLHSLAVIIERQI